MENKKNEDKLVAIKESYKDVLTESEALTKD